MPAESFAATIRSGHKVDEVPLPFDPAARWGARAVRFAPGRFGYAVEGTMNGVPFESHVVVRSGSFLLLVPRGLERLIDGTHGSTVQVLIAPLSGDS